METAKPNYIPCIHTHKNKNIDRRYGAMTSRKNRVILLIAADAAAKTNIEHVEKTKRSNTDLT